jgi:formate/nitrite transporter FocA (FNT family)
MKEGRTITEFGRVPTQRIWWSAIFAGTFVGLGIVILFSLFGLVIGAVLPVREETSVRV